MAGERIPVKVPPEDLITLQQMYRHALERKFTRSWTEPGAEREVERELRVFILRIAATNQNLSTERIAERLRCEKGTVRRVLHDYNDQGMASVIFSGRGRKADGQKQLEIVTTLQLLHEQVPELTLSDLCPLIDQLLGYQLKPKTLQTYLRKAGVTFQREARRSTRAFGSEGLRP